MLLINSTLHFTAKKYHHMKTNRLAANRKTYAKPTVRTIEIKLKLGMMLLNSNGTTTQTTPDLEEQDYSNIWGN